jgi:hypothetical protein
MLRRIFFYGTIFVLSYTPTGLPLDSRSPDPKNDELLSGKAVIYKIKPEKGGGTAYKLFYVVRVPIAVLWKFKTDFDNRFLVTNKFIDEHRLIRREGKIAITEVVYSYKPGVKFVWRTTLSPATYRLDFVLTNPEACGQRFHYGFIQLEALGKNTRVTQFAHFDFFGAFLWANYPWKGGMSAFLKYMARWEQETVFRLKEEYAGQISKETH